MAANPSHGEQQVGWISAKSGRGTADILWSCLIIFAVCSWKCVHLNIPSLDESRAGWYLLRSVPFCPKPLLLRKWLRKLVWMGVIVIAPEAGVARAVREYNQAQDLSRYMGDGWTLTHAFYANMGGFALRPERPLPEPQPANARTDVKHPPVNAVVTRKTDPGTHQPSHDRKSSQHRRSKSAIIIMTDFFPALKTEFSKETSEEFPANTFWVNNQNLSESWPFIYSLQCSQLLRKNLMLQS